MICRLLVGGALVVGLSLAPQVSAHHAAEPQVAAPAAPASPAPELRALGRAPFAVVASTRDVRSIADCGDAVWVATRGGVDRYVPGSWGERRHYATEEGLDTLDVHRVRCEGSSPVVETATGLCHHVDRAFQCHAARSSTADAPVSGSFHGEPVTSRVHRRDGDVIGTAGAGAFWVPTTGPAVELGAGREGGLPLRGFVRTLVAYRDQLWLGTFDNGLYVVDATAEAVMASPSLLSRARSVRAPIRMVNDAVVADGALYVAANEGLFVTRDGRRFSRVAEVRSRGVTSLAASGGVLYATTTSALWRVVLSEKAPRLPAFWTPAGSRSLQGVVADAQGLWLASEDRGVIRFDGSSFVAYDRLAGLPTSWVVALAADGAGGVFAATLRDGALHVGRDGVFQPMEGLPSRWTLSVARLERQVCVGTQDGMACFDDETSGQRTEWRASALLTGLPDGRVHAMMDVRGAMLASTEAGLALYAAP